MAYVTSSDLEHFRRVPYFSGLPGDVLSALAAVAIERHFSRGQVIFLEGEPCAGLHLVIRGRVKTYKLSPQGREQIVHQAGAGETFNDVAALDGGPNPSNAGALTDVDLYVIPRSQLRHLTEIYPQLAWALIESVARRTRQLVAMVEDLSLRSVKERLARLLLAEAQRGQPSGPLDRSQMMTQAEMAAQLDARFAEIGKEA